MGRAGLNSTFSFFLIAWSFDTSWSGVRSGASLMIFVRGDHFGRMHVSISVAVFRQRKGLGQLYCVRSWVHKVQSHSFLFLWFGEVCWIMFSMSPTVLTLWLSRRQFA